MSNSEFAFHTVIRLNQQAVDLFTKVQDHKRACIRFQEALKLLQMMFKDEKANAQSRVAKTNDETPSVSSQSDQSRTSGQSLDGSIGLRAKENYAPDVEGPIVPVDSSHLSREGSHNIRRLLSRLDEAGLYVSTRPVRLAFPTHPRNCSRLKSIVALTISYNIGLSHHVLSFAAPPQKASNHLNVALTFYNVAVTLRTRTAKRFFQDPRLAYLELSILNNVAVLHHQLGNNACAQHVFQELDTRLHHHKSTMARSQGSTAGFIGNVNQFLRTTGWKSKPAPAA